MIDRIKKLFASKFDPARYDSLIAKGTTVIGTVQFSGVLLVAGSVTGKFQPQGEGPFGIIVERGAVIKLEDTLRADYVIVRGSILGDSEDFDLHALQLLHLESTAVVGPGAIHIHKSLVVDSGARLQGMICDHKLEPSCDQA